VLPFLGTNRVDVMNERASCSFWGRKVMIESGCRAKKRMHKKEVEPGYFIQYSD
jgi:hypothetical protein